MERRAFMKGIVPMAGVMLFPFGFSAKEEKWVFAGTRIESYPTPYNKIRYSECQYESPCKRFKLTVAEHIPFGKVPVSSPGHSSDYRCVHVESTDPKDRYGIFWSHNISPRDGSTQLIPSSVDVQTFDYPDLPEVMMRRSREEKGYVEEQNWGSDIWGQPMKIGGVREHGRSIPCRIYYKCLVNGNSRGLYYRCVRSDASKR